MGDEGDSDGAAASSGSGRRHVPQEQIETILSAFPQVTENQARWDLGRSGSLEMTMERLLRDGRLPNVCYSSTTDSLNVFLLRLEAVQPPVNLFPASGNVPRATRASAPSASKATSNASASTLIQKLGLQARAEEQDALLRDSHGKGKAVDPAEHGLAPPPSTSSGKADTREDALKERKAKMVLDARW